MKNFKRILLARLFFLFCLSPSLYAGHFSTRQGANSCILSGDSITVQITAFQEDIIKIDYIQKTKKDKDIRFSVILQPDSNIILRMSEKKDRFVLSTKKMTVEILKATLRIDFYDMHYQPLLLSSMDTINSDYTRSVHFRIQPKDRFYGLGQKSIPIDRMGYKFRMINKHIGGYTRPYANMQINIPYLYSPIGYGILFDVHYPGTFDLGETDSTRWSFSVENGPFGYYMIHAESLIQLQNKYFELTGYPPMLPIWTLGMLQSRCVYHNEQEVYGVIDQYERKNLPLDAIILDLYWFGTFNREGPRYMGNFSWYKNHFPDPAGYMKKLKSLGIKTVLISEPIINLDSHHYPLLKKNGWLVFREDKNKPFVLTPYWAGDASLFDMTHPDAQNWLWSRYRDLIASGVDGLWTDLGEPEADIPRGQAYSGSLLSIHNLFNLLWARTIWDGFQRDFPDKRPFNLTRSGYTGIQRFGTANWSGDASKTWNALQLQVSMMVGAVMSGIPHFSSDIGGFANAWDIDDETAFTNLVEGRVFTTGELYTRWFQLGVFSPMLRPHSGEGQACEPFAFDKNTEMITSEYIRLRYRLIPYIYSYMHKTAILGETLIKPTFFKFEDEQAVHWDNTYMFGNEMLIAPVLHEKTEERSVYLPRLKKNSQWIDFWTDRPFKSGQETIARAPLNIIPVFIPQPSIFPMGKVKKYVHQSLDDTITVHVYPGGQASFKLYEDDGETNAYRKGDYGITVMKTYSNDDKIHISISPVRGHYDSMVKRRTWHVIVHLIKKYENLRLAEQTEDKITYHHNQEKNILESLISASTDTPINLTISEVTLTTRIK